ncbi:pentapeptide repeat-containing protein [Bacillus niameyensis]|uniref:pentapeptide repeat-containing protein n=1 Tax=Bacillus niameyensis TaxID=1522308 RepID=UPI000780E667|nr:pentapeptide repeat-containing protein [Bacillus niameyensis]
MKKKMREIHRPDLSENMKIRLLDEVTDRSSHEFGKIESNIGPVHAEHVHFIEIHFNGVSFEQCQLPFSSWVDVIFENCDLSNIDLKKAQFTRVEFRKCKLAGTNFDQAMMRDVQFSHCEAPYALFNLAEVQDVLFNASLLKGANFIDAHFNNVQFHNSNIQDVQFTGTSLRNIDLSLCQFDYIHADERDLRGAIIAPEQALSFIELFGLKVKYD